MISNYVIESKQRDISNKREVLVKEKSELQKALTALGISTGQARKRNTEIDERTIQFRNNIIQRLKDIDKEFSDLNEEKRNLHRKSEASRNQMLKLMFREIFNTEQLEEIGNECDRRVKGEIPTPLSFNFDNYKRFKDDYYKYKELAKIHLNKTIETRILLTKIIEEGCQKYGDAEFLKLMSPINKLIIPLNELQKIKATYLL